VSNDRRHRLGALGERLAEAHLVRRGFQIVERNYRTRWGELDIVAFDGHTLAFVEVKTRQIGPGGGHPFDSVRSVKRTRIRKLAGRWLVERKQRPYAELLRFDVIGITLDGTGQLVSLEHLEGGF
jgi:putative endonuclease